MLRRLLPLGLLLAAVSASAETLYQPSCWFLIALADDMRFAGIERAFGKPFDVMSADEFSTAFATVDACLDHALARGPEPPGLFRWEQRATQVRVLSLLAEEMRFRHGRAQTR
jgi:hypothetical protein